MLNALVVTISGMNLDFTKLVPLYGSSAATKLASAWHQQFVGWGKSQTAMRFRDFTRFLKWIAARAEVAPNSVEAAFFLGVQRCQSTSLTQSVVHAAGEAWATRLRDRDCFEIVSTTNLLSRRALLESVSVCLQRLARSGLWANPGRLRPVISGKIVGGNLPSLGELNKVSREKLRGWVKPQHGNLDWQEVIRLNETRLARLRSICARDLAVGVAKWERGQALIADPAIPVAGNPEELHELLRSLHLRRRALPDAELQKVRDRALGLLVKYLALTDPHRRTFLDMRETPICSHVTHAGGWRNALEHVEGGFRSLLAAQTIVMIDTGFNVSTCERLAASPFIGDVTRGKVRIITVAAAKLRARGEIQEGLLLEGADIDASRADGAISGAEAIRCWQRLSARLRATAVAHGMREADQLWITVAYNSDLVRTTATHQLVDHFWHIFLDENFDDPIIGGLPIRRQMIRPTVLQLESARGNFEHALAARLGQHKQAATTMRYLSRPWFKALLASKMRTYLNAFEAAVAAPIPGAVDAIGSTAAHQESLDHATATGLGFLCTAPRTAAAFGKELAGCGLPPLK